MSYVLELKGYRGPIEKLLELVENEKMEVSLISVARVTEDFLAYFQNLKETEEGVESHLDALEQADLKMILADFLLIASRLVLIKSRVLIPSLPLEHDDEVAIEDLEKRIQIYQDLKGAKDNILKLWAAKPYVFSREFLMQKEIFFYPPENVRIDDLVGVMSRLLGELQKFLAPVKEIKNETINLSIKIKEVLNRLSNGMKSFSDFHDKKTRSELVVLFLAVLHLVREQLVQVEQSEHFGEMTIAKKTENKVE